MRAAVLGTGSWGTAYAKVLTDAGTATTLWARRPEIAAAIRTRHQNPDYLPGVRLPTQLTATDDPTEALDGADLVVLAVPSQTLRENLQSVRAAIPGDATLVSLMKGIELGSTKRMSEVITEVVDVPATSVAVVSGPNLAREIAAEQPAATVVACTDLRRAEQVQRASMTAYFRPYTNADVVGCELAGAVKNVIALACGAARGLGFGDNTMATLVTRGLAETTRLGAALGADPATFAGLAGLGDLVATCNSPLSRNRTFGEWLGKGLSVEQAAARTRETAEGVESCRSILELARKHAVDMPITASVEAVVYEGMSIGELGAQLMTRQPRAE
ncbi:MAG TPA: NAD(P)H-dependent glycerol-3-phosphate dehydrogenase [Mycobacteriales bacterium]|nr:NAD(P)H-dependent glycerol-3-phosphate dehydrogenase [Mycobacteriales bacterium]